MNERGDLAKQRLDHAMAVIGASIEYNDPDDEGGYDEDFVIQCMLTDLMHYCHTANLDFDSIQVVARADYESERKQTA